MDLHAANMARIANAVSSVQSHSLSSIHYCRHTMQHFCSQLSDVSTFSKEAKIVLFVISVNDNVIVKVHRASQSVTKSPFNRENQGKHKTGFLTI